MRIHRTLPPAASPIYPRDILSGFRGVFRGRKELACFRSEIKEYFGVKHCFLVSSGKAGLTLILQALKELYPNRDEVLIPAFTCYSVPSAIVRAGLKIKLCDIDENTLDFDFNQLERILDPSGQLDKPLPCWKPMLSDQGNEHNEPNEPKKSYELPSPNKYPASSIQHPASRSRLLSIVSAHLFGLPAKTELLQRLVDDPEVTIIEDAAQTMGAECQGKKLGTLGDVSFFSMGRGKALSTVEGGIILTNRDEISDKLRILIKKVAEYSIFNLLTLIFNAVSLSFFLHPNLFWFPKSLPFLRLGETIYYPHFKIKKMSAFQAGLASAWQKKILDFKKCRAENSKLWGSILVRNSNHYYCFVKEVTQGTQATQLPDLLRFPLRVNNSELRNRILMESQRKGLGIMFTYPDSIDGIEGLRGNFQGLDFPVAKKTAHQLITLPVHPLVSTKDREEISKFISQISNYELTA